MTTKSERLTDILISLVILIVFLFIVNCAFALMCLQSVGKTRWPKGAFRFNPQTAYEMTPFLSTKMLDNSYLLYTHRLGYRIPAAANNNKTEKGGILSIGCSFTFGDSVEAEQTFTAVAAEALHLPSYNYGVCSYSYANMILQLQELKERGILEELEPSILILGAGNWLMSRSTNPFLPSPSIVPLVSGYIGKKDTNLQIIKLQKILYTRIPFSLEDEHSPGGKRRFWPMFKNFCLMTTDVPRILYLKFMQAVLPSEPDVDSFELYDLVISEITKVMSPYKMKFVILWMPTEYIPADRNQSVEEGLRMAVAQHNGVILVNGLDAVRKYNVTSEDYVSIHPRPKAHEAYAKEILSNLQN